MATDTRPVDAAQTGGRASASHSWWDRTSENPWLFVAVFLVTVVVAAVLITVGSIWSSGDVPLEWAKAGLQLLAIAIFGGAVAAAFRSLEAGRERRRLNEAADREDERRRDDYRATRSRRQSRRAGRAGGGT